MRLQGKITTLINYSVINKTLLEKLKMIIIFKMAALLTLKDINDAKTVGKM